MARALTFPDVFHGVVRTCPRLPRRTRDQAQRTATCAIACRPRVLLPFRDLRAGARSGPALVPELLSRRSAGQAARRSACSTAQITLIAPCWRGDELPACARTSVQWGFDLLIDVAVWRSDTAVAEFRG